MEIKNLCTLREIYRAIRNFEISFQEKYDLCLNEGLLLCNLRSRKLTSTEIAESLDVTPSNASKLIRSVEEKGFIKRSMGKDDRRQMYFSLSASGKEKLKNIACECDDIEPDEILKSIQIQTK